MNIIHVVGRVGQAPETRYLDTGTCVVNFSLAVKRRTKDAAPDWFKVECWGKSAEIASNYVQKGTQVGIVGQFALEEWTKESQPQVTPKIKVLELSLLGKKGETLDSSSDSSASSGATPSADAFDDW